MAEAYDTYADEENTTVSRKRPYENENENSDKQTRSRDSKRPNGKQPLLKLLVPNYAAGAIIGKGGTNIGELQNRYGASIRLSHNREFYPGTDERIVVLIGEVSQIIDFHDYIIDKVHQDASEGPGKRPRDDARGQQVKIILTNSTAGLIIGRGGTTIKALQDETKAKIMITGRDESKVVGERVLTITGNTEQRIEAARQVISKIAADPDNMANSNLKYSHGDNRDNYGGGGGMDNSYNSQNGMGNMFRNFPQDNQNNLLSALSQNPLSALSQNPLSALSQNPLSALSQNPLSALSQNPLSALSQNPLSALGLDGSANIANLSNLGGVAQQLAELTQSSNVQNNIKTTVQIEMEIPDVLVGPIMGFNGNTIHEFIQFSGAKIQFSSKNDFAAPGTNQRILTIHGDLNQTQIAYYLVNQKITQAQNELATRGFQRH